MTEEKNEHGETPGSETGPEIGGTTENAENAEKEKRSEGQGQGQGQTEPSRRDFLSTAVVGLGVCAGAGVLGVVGTAAVGTPLARDASGAGWYDVGPLDRFEDGAVVKIPIKGERTDAWNRFRADTVGRVVIVRKGEAVRVFSSVCPHNGCDVFVAKTELLCPCHDSNFGFDGSLKGGKSPRGLDPLEHEVREGRLRIRYQRFELGTPERKPIQ